MVIHFLVIYAVPVWTDAVKNALNVFWVMNFAKSRDDHVFVPGIRTLEQLVAILVVCNVKDAPSLG